MTAATIAGVAATYTHNGDGLRISRTIGSESASYVWDMAAGLPMIVQDGSDSFVYGLGRVSVTEAGGTQVYFLYDGLGSTVGMVDINGNSIATYTYDVYGGVRSHTGSDTEFSFTGEQNDPNGLEYLRARYYDPATGRFLGRDPVACNHPYRYASNNPAVSEVWWSGCPFPRHTQRDEDSLERLGDRKLAYGRPAITISR